MKNLKIYIAIIGLSVLSIQSYGEKRTDYVNQGKSHLIAMDIENAIDSFSKAIENKQNVAEAHLHRAEAYLISGDCEKASEDYRKAFDMDSEYYKKYLNITPKKPFSSSAMVDYIAPEYGE